jgi:hypothetical protein
MLLPPRRGGPAAQVLLRSTIFQSQITDLCKVAASAPSGGAPPDGQRVGLRGCCALRQFELLTPFNEPCCCPRDGGGPAAQVLLRSTIFQSQITDLCKVAASAPAVKHREAVRGRTRARLGSCCALRWFELVTPFNEPCCCPRDRGSPSGTQHRSMRERA